MTLTKVTNRMIDGASVNVRDFGAVGDGVHDDTAAIQAALDSLRDRIVSSPLHDGQCDSAGMSIVDGGGLEYLVTGTINLPPRTGGYTIANATFKAGPAFPLDSYIFATDTATTKDSVHFRHIFINGNLRANGIFLDTFIRCTFDTIHINEFYKIGIGLHQLGYEAICERVFLKNTDGAAGRLRDAVGIFIEAGATDNHFENCVIEGVSTGIRNNGIANEFDKIHVYDATIAIELANNPTQCNIVNSYGDGCYFQIENPRYCSFNNNRVIDTSRSIPGLILRSITPNHETTSFECKNNGFFLMSGIEAIQLAGTFSTMVRNTTIADNSGNVDVIIRGTRFKKTFDFPTGTQSTTVDISSSIILGALRDVHVTLSDPDSNNKEFNMAQVYNITGTSVSVALVKTTVGSNPFPITGVEDGVASANTSLTISFDTSIDSNTP